MKELNIEEKAQRYDDAIERAKGVIKQNPLMEYLKKGIEYIFPELKESEDERIRKELIDFLEHYRLNNVLDSKTIFLLTDSVAWLEKQGEQSNWKPSKDEMDALYGLAYITNKMDDKKDEAVTKLYQDLKREFFNGASYENMFPSSPVDSEINYV
jgi:hypothetical protein